MPRFDGTGPLGKGLMAVISVGAVADLVSTLVQKGWILCQEVMVQVLLVKDQEQGGAWVEAKPKVGAGWAEHLPQGRAEPAFAQNAATGSHMLLDNHVI